MTRTMATEPTNVDRSPDNVPDPDSSADEPRTSGPDRRAIVLALAAAACVCLAVWALSRLLAPAFFLIDEAVLRGEKGRVEHGSLLAPAERLRLDLRLHRPAAVLALLVEPRGEVLEIYPAPGDIPLLAPGDHRLPPDGGAWESDALEHGPHHLWLLAAAEVVSEEKRGEAVDRFRKIVQAGVRGEDSWSEDLREAVSESGMEFLPFSFSVERAR